MKIRHVFGSIAACVVLLPALAAARGAGAAAELAERMAERLQALQSVEAEGEIVVSYKMGGQDRTQRAPWSLAYAAPNKLRMKGPGLDVTADGTYLYSRSPAGGEYVKIEITQSMLSALADNLAQGVNLMPDEQALLSDDAAGILAAFTSEYPVTVREDAELDGLTCWRVDLVLEDLQPELDVPINVWIDQASGLVRQWRVEAETVNKLLKEGKGPVPPGADPPEIIEYGETAKVMKVNEPIDAAVFTFTPEAGEKEVEFFTYGLDPNPERFALSGKEAPDFEVELIDEGTFRLSRDAEDKVVLLDFWATWCGPCLAALPHMAELAKEMEGRDVVFLGISVDEPGARAQVPEVFRGAGAEYLCGYDKDDIDEDYEVSGIPCMVLIDRDGNVVGRYTGFAPPTKHFLEAAIGKLLAGEELETAEPSR
jgi:thiol-disulfide isomerase/thioredoxin/outer membrane lipoprotein-sorting protein